MRNVAGAVRKLISTADDNKKVIDDVLAKVHENKLAMKAIDDNLRDFRIDIDDIKARIECLPEMKEQIHVRDIDYNRKL